MRLPTHGLAAILLTAVAAVVGADQGRSTAGTVWLWDAETGELLQQFDGHMRQVVCVDVSADGRQVLSGGRDGTVRLWDAATGKELKRYATDTTRIGVVKFSPDEKSSLFSTPDGIIHQWNLSTGKIDRKLQPRIKVDYDWYFNDHLVDLAFSEDEQRVAACSRKRGVAIWNLKTGEPIGRVVQSPIAASVDFRGDLKRLVVGGPRGGSDVGRVGVVDVATGDVRWFKTEPVAKHERGVNYGSRYDLITSVACSPDGKVAITGSESGEVRLWETLGGKQLKRYYGHDTVVNCVQISPDGKFGLSGGQDGKVLLWNLLHEAAVRRYIGNTEEVTCLAFSGDGKRFASGGGQTSPSKAVKSGGAEEPLAAAQPRRVVEGLDQPWSVAVDSKEEKVYWCNDSTIYRANVDGSEIEELLVGLKEPNGLTIDERARRMFWLERNNYPPTVYHARLNGSDRKSLDLHDRVQPLGAMDFALDRDSETIFLVAPNYGPHIRRFGYDGSQREDVILSGLGDVRDVGVDPVEGKLYWSDLGLGKIKRANTDGTRIETIYAETTPGEVLRNLIVDPRSRKIFWLHRGEAVGIRRANLDGTQVEDLTIATHREDGPKGRIYTYTGDSPSHYYYQFTADTRNGWLYWTGHPSERIVRLEIAERK